jgi:hypothetical protein
MMPSLLRSSTVMSPTLDQVLNHPGVSPIACRDLLEDVELAEGADGRGGGVEQRDEEQRPQRGVAGGAHALGRVEAHDHVRQAGGAEHQRRRDQDHVRHRGRGEGLGVGREAQVLLQAVQLGQDLPEGDLRQRDAVSCAEMAKAGMR